MSMHKLKHLFGFAGVEQSENARALRWSHIFEWPMVLVAFWILMEWYLSESGALTAQRIAWTSFAIWLLFSVETLVLSMLVNDRSRYLKGNWMNLLIILLAVPFIFEEAYQTAALRIFRLIVLIDLLLTVSGAFRTLMRRNHLGLTLMVCFVITLMAGVMIASIDPSIETPWDGLWWAWVTVSTVGYGDVVPQSTAGKIFASLLIAMGVGLFSMLVASFSAFFMAKEEEVVVEAEQQALSKLDKIEATLSRLEEKIDALEQRVEKR